MKFDIMKRELDEDFLQKSSAVNTSLDKRVISQRRYYTLTIHQIRMMKVLIAVGIASILALFTLEFLYFRRAIFILLIPTFVTICTIVGIVRLDERLLWPIIGISFFHLFLASYALLIFSFFFFFKPLYIVMVLNWAFDTLYTTTTLSFYLYSLAIYCILVAFFLFNLWQLRISLRFRTFLIANTTDRDADDGISAASSGGTSEVVSVPPSKVLNEPPIIFSQKNSMEGANGSMGFKQSTYQQHCQSILPMSAQNNSNPSFNNFVIDERQMVGPDTLNMQPIKSRRPSLTEGKRFAI